MYNLKVYFLQSTLPTYIDDNHVKVHNSIQSDQKLSHWAIAYFKQFLKLQKQHTFWATFSTVEVEY
jgi:hypothetical protein